MENNDQITVYLQLVFGKGGMYVLKESKFVVAV